MRLSKLFKNPLITGTLFMSAAGVISRLIGFFYRIFLSRTIGAEGLGIYQLIAPVFSICFALTASSIQTAISKFVGDSIGSCNTGECGERRGRAYLIIGLVLSCVLSLITGFVVYHYADFIAERFLGEARCAPLLVLLTYSLLPACIHSCINGYYYGKKRALVPSICQLMEQVVRVGGVYIIYLVTQEKGIPLTPVHAVAGLVMGEFAGLFTCLLAFSFEPKPEKNTVDTLHQSSGPMFRMFLGMVIPLTLNRLTVSVCNSLENLLIPKKLMAFGYSNSDALSIYGVLTGMAFSIILFPNVLTNSLSVLLLPSVSEAQGQKNLEKIADTIKKATLLGLLLGLCFTILFLLTGRFIGSHIFHNALAGVFIRRLSFLCPLMYITGLLSSILQGLGHAGRVLYVNLLACLMRIGMILFLVPVYGIGAYLWGMLFSYVFTTIACLWLLRAYRKV
ncbi:MAG: oligosaccharide flippase family protein [Agathobacter sp.]